VTFGRLGDPIIISPFNATDKRVDLITLSGNLPVEKGNQAARDGSLGRVIDKLIEQTKPEPTATILMELK